LRLDWFGGTGLYLMILSFIIAFSSLSEIEHFFCVFQTGVCSPGFFCLSGAISSTPTDGVTGNYCARGGYCPAGVLEYHNSVFFE
jgi:hypothetical protein